MGPFWLDDAPPTPPGPRYDGRVDVAIVGGGITGCSCALALASAGLRVRVHDARGIAEGASGRNGGFALRGGAARYDVARESYGAAASASLWRWTEDCLDRMVELGDGALRRTGSLRLAADEEERGQILAEYEALREDGFAAEWRDDLPPHLGSFHGAIFHPARRLDPACAVRAPARRARGRGRRRAPRGRAASRASTSSTPTRS